MNTMIDQTLLKPDATQEQILKLCEEAKEHRFASVCVNPWYVPTVRKALEGSLVKTCTVVGFPLGATSIKAQETARALQDGAEEIDMVIALGALKQGDDAAVFADIESVVQASEYATVKVIIETCLLSETEKIRACRLALSAGADFVKTSTGFSTGGATVEDIRLMRSVVGQNFGVKASGGIRTLSDALAMIEAGANRIGTSAGIQIVSAYQNKNVQ